MQKKFNVGDRVRITEDFTWARGATGTVEEYYGWTEIGKDGTIGFDGVGRQMRGASGKILTFYDVEFDTPQVDADGDGPYSGGAIESEYLELIE